MVQKIDAVPENITTVAELTEEDKTLVLVSGIAHVFELRDFVTHLEQLIEQGYIRHKETYLEDYDLCLSHVDFQVIIPLDIWCQGFDWYTHWDKDGTVRLNRDCVRTDQEMTDMLQKYPVQMDNIYV